MVVVFSHKDFAPLFMVWNHILPVVATCRGAAHPMLFGHVRQIFEVEHLLRLRGRFVWEIAGQMEYALFIWTTGLMCWRSLLRQLFNPTSVMYPAQPLVDVLLWHSCDIMEPVLGPLGCDVANLRHALRGTHDAHLWDQIVAAMSPFVWY